MSDLVIIRRLIKEGWEGKIEKPIPKNTIVGWLNAEDQEKMGAVYDLISNEECIRKIDPPLEWEEIYPFLFRVLKFSIFNDPSGTPHSIDRYQACQEIVRWFEQAWQRKAKGDIPEKFKEWLGEMYRKGTEKIRECLISATLAHIFEKIEVANYFSDWRGDPILRGGYEEALGYSREIAGRVQV